MLGYSISTFILIYKNFFIYSSMDNNISTLLKQLDQRLQQKKKMNKDYYKNGNPYDEKNMDRLVNNEINNLVLTKKWNGLPKYLKWSNIKNYLLKYNINDPQIVNNLKKLVSNNKLIGITYDHKIQEIIKIPNIYLS